MDAKRKVSPTVHGVLHFVVVESDSVHHVVIAATDRADRQAMATRANRVLEGDVLFRPVSELTLCWKSSFFRRFLNSVSPELTVPELTATQSSWL